MSQIHPFLDGGKPRGMWLILCRASPFPLFRSLEPERSFTAAPSATSRRNGGELRGWNGWAASRKKLEQWITGQESETRSMAAVFLRFIVVGTSLRFLQLVSFLSPIPRVFAALHPMKICRVCFRNPREGKRLNSDRGCVCSPRPQTMLCHLALLDTAVTALACEEPLGGVLDGCGPAAMAVSCLMTHGYCSPSETGSRKGSCSQR